MGGKADACSEHPLTLTLSPFFHHLSSKQQAPLPFFILLNSQALYPLRRSWRFSVFILKAISLCTYSGLACRRPHLHILLEFARRILRPADFLCRLGYRLPWMFDLEPFERDRLYYGSGWGF